MSYLIVFTVFLGFAILLASGKVRPPVRWLRPVAICVSGAISLLSLVAASFYTVPPDQVGHLIRVYLADNLPKGRIIALDGELGPQARILGPGFHFSPGLRLLHDIEEYSVVTIGPGQMGVVTALDGTPLRPGQFIADPWGEDNIHKMLDAEYFLSHGGQRGVQETVLPPGSYRFNRYLFNVAVWPALDVKAGTVAVIKSNVQTRKDCHEPISSSLEGETGGVLTTPLVERGCIGIWREALTPGRYYLNPEAYTPTIVPTTVQTWAYKGGYKSRRINLQIDSKGNITQQEEQFRMDVPDGAADSAVVVTTEGWRVPMELRMLVQVDPADAPVVVAAVGTLRDVENKVATPGIRSILRNVAGQKGRKVLDLVVDRPEIERVAEEKLSPELKKAGVTLKEIRLGDPVIPPELLVTRRREQLAQQLESTYAQEKKAQEKRIAVEKAKAVADEQNRLVRADIDVSVAERKKKERHLLGEGEKLRLMEIAEGNRAQAEVLGEKSALHLALTKILVEAAVKNPQIVKFPLVYSAGGNGGSLDTAAAILGISNISRLGAGMGVEAGRVVEDAAASGSGR